MSVPFATDRFTLGLATWAEEAATPNAGAGTPAAVGSWWQRQGSYPATPTLLYSKQGSSDRGWARQNLVNVAVYNVKDPAYGAVGDGVTDDGPAIQAAVNAANAAGGGVVYFPPVDVAGGKFYRLRKPATNLGSIMLDNVHNITFLGDGYASKVEMLDDSGAVPWNAFQVTNGSSRIGFFNHQLSGVGVTNPSVGNNNLINVASLAADANVGVADIMVNGMFWGSCAAGSRLYIIGDDAAHVVTDVTYRYNLGDTTSDCAHVVELTGTSTGGFFDRVEISDNFVSRPNTTGQEAIQFTPPTFPLLGGYSWLVAGNVVDHQSTTGRAINCQRGITSHNIVVNGGNISATGAGGTTNNPKYRGNVVTITFAGQTSPMLDFSSVSGGCAAIGNVAINLSDSNRNGVFNSGGAIAENSCSVQDNIFSVQSSASQPVAVLCQNTIRTLIDGNIAIIANNPVNNGTHLRAQNTNLTTAEAVVITGNLCLVTSANEISSGIDIQVSNAIDMHSGLANYNLIRAPRGVQFLRSSGNVLNWRTANDNNVLLVTVDTVTKPTTNVGVTIEGPASPGSQIVLNGTTPVANVPAPQGSLCANTAGGQGTALSYKESGAGVSGGTGGWFGIGGAEIVFGALAGSLATGSRFFAPGGLGLAAESATEIQVPVTRAGTVRNFRLRCVAGTGGGTNTYTVRKNGVSSGVVGALANTATNVVDTTHSFTVVPGDLISIGVTKSVAPATAQTRLVMTLEIV